MWGPVGAPTEGEGPPLQAEGWQAAPRVTLKMLMEPDGSKEVGLGGWVGAVGELEC